MSGRVDGCLWEEDRISLFFILGISDGENTKGGGEGEKFNISVQYL